MIAALSLLPVAAAMTGIDAHDLHLAPGSPGLAVWVGAPTRGLSGAGVLEYAARPLVLHTEDDQELLLSGLFSLDLSGSWEVASGCGLHVALPVHNAVAGSASPGHPVLGDLQLSASLPLAVGPVDAGVRLLGHLPTGAPRHHLGSGLPRVGAEVGLSSGGPVLEAGVSAGARSGPRLSTYDLRGGAQALLGAVVAVTPLDPFSFGLEGRLRASLNPLSPRSSESPAEGTLFARLHAKPVALLLGGSLGIGPGVGAPLARVFLGIRRRG